MGKTFSPAVFGAVAEPSSPTSARPDFTTCTTSSGVNAASTVTDIAGKAAVNRLMIVVKGSMPGLGIDTSSTRPRRSPRVDWTVALAASRSRSTWRAGSTSCAPALESTMPRPTRWNRGTPSSCSKVPIAWESDGWAMCSCSAARPKLRCSTTARKYVSWRPSIAPPEAESIGTTYRWCWKCVLDAGGVAHSMWEAPHQPDHTDLEVPHHEPQPDSARCPARKTRWYRQLYVQVLVAIILGVVVGAVWPNVGVAMEPIGTTFVTLMKMLIGPIVFLTIVGGIAGVADLKKVGLTGLKALTYFQIGTIIALATGLVAINLLRLGNGVNADPSTLKTTGDVTPLVQAGEQTHWWDFLLRIVPESVFGPFVEGEILQIIFLAVIFGIALNAVGSVGAPVLSGVQRLTAVVFKVLAIIMKAAPLGAFGAMAFAIGKYGLSTLTSLGSLIALFYVTSALFVVVVLGSVMASMRLNIFHLLRYLREELVLILGTSTAEPALPGLMKKLEHAGVQKPTVGLVVPTGYSFNLDGAAIYLSLSALYIAPAPTTDPR